MLAELHQVAVVKGEYQGSVKAAVRFIQRGAETDDSVIASACSLFLWGGVEPCNPGYIYFAGGEPFYGLKIVFIAELRIGRQGYICQFIFFQ